MDSSGILMETLLQCGLTRNNQLIPRETKDFLTSMHLLLEVGTSLGSFFPFTFYLF